MYRSIKIFERRLAVTDGYSDKMNSKNLNASRHLEAADQEVHSNPHKKKKKKHSLAFRIFKKLMTVIATTLLSLLLVIIITGTIVSSALTVYVLKFMDDSTTVTLQELESGSDTFFFAQHLNTHGDLIMDEQSGSIACSMSAMPQPLSFTLMYTSLFGSNRTVSSISPFLCL